MCSKCISFDYYRQKALAAGVPKEQIKGNVEPLLNPKKQKNGKQKEYLYQSLIGNCCYRYNRKVKEQFF